MVVCRGAGENFFIIDLHGVGTGDEVERPGVIPGEVLAVAVVDMGNGMGARLVWEGFEGEAFKD